MKSASHIVLIIPALFLLVGIFLISNQALPTVHTATYTLLPGESGTLAINPLAEETIVATTSFAHACTSGPEARCELGKYGEVLRTRALNPNYKLYEDTSTGISFEYPSSVATVRKQFYTGQSGQPKDYTTYFYIEPIMPEPVYTEFWFGATVSTRACNAHCSTDLSAYLEQNALPHIDGSISKFEIISDDVVMGNYHWVKAHVSYPIGSTAIWYSTTGHGVVITIISDVEEWGLDFSPSIYTAFHRIIETLKF